MEDIIAVDNLVKRYGDMVALDHFSLHIAPGEVFGLLGPNGSGKTTAINCMLQLLTYDKGSIRLFGEDMKPSRYDLKRRIGVVPVLGGFFLLPRIVGLQRAKELVFSAREVDAEEARALGILYRIVPAPSLLEEALALAARFHAASTEALGMSKNILNRSFNLDQNTLAELEAHAQALALHTSYHDDAVSRFLDKQPLAFNWSAKPGKDGAA